MVLELIYRLLFICAQFDKWINYSPKEVSQVSATTMISSSTSISVTKVHISLQIDPMMETSQIKPINPGTALLANLIFKVTILALFYLSYIFEALLSENVIVELILIFVVVDFWFTKNISGRKMLGLRWEFGEDCYGVQRFKYQCRINPEYVNKLALKLFWIIQFLYLAVPLNNLTTIISIAPNIEKLSIKDIALNILMFISNTANIFFFCKASSASAQKQKLLIEIYGKDFLLKMGESTIVSYS